MSSSEPKQEMLFGYPKYDVESLADTIMRSREAELNKNGMYQAALKVLERRQKALGMVLQVSVNKRRK